MAGGFRIKIVGERGGDPDHRPGTFSKPSDAVEKVLDSALRQEAKTLLGVLKAATPVYREHPLDRHIDRGLKEGWRLSGLQQTSATGVAIDISNVATAPGLERVSLIHLLATTGAQRHRIPKYGDTLLAFPLRHEGLANKRLLRSQRRWLKTKPEDRGKMPGMPEEGYLQYATHVQHPGFRARDFIDKALREEAPAKAIAHRLQRQGAGRAILSLMEEGSFRRSQPTLPMPSGLTPFD